MSPNHRSGPDTLWPHGETMATGRSRSRCFAGLIRLCVASSVMGSLGALGGCAAKPCLQNPSRVQVVPPAAAAIESEVYRRAETDRAARLAREVEELRGDLQQAEEALVAAESGLRGSYTRADAISRLAEARIRVARASNAAPWRSSQIHEAQEKLADAERQVAAGHFGAGLFLVYRAERISDALEDEARRVQATPGTRFVRSGRVNLRSGPSTDEAIVSVLTLGTPVFPESDESPWVLVRTASGDVGWVHATLIDD
jgi:hypothetical protein